MMDPYAKYLGWTPGQWRTVNDWYVVLPLTIRSLFDNGVYDPEVQRRHTWKVLNSFEPHETAEPAKCHCCGKPL